MKFSSFGNPSRTRGTYLKGDCNDPNSSIVVEKAYLNKNDCIIKLSEENFKTKINQHMSWFIKETCSGSSLQLIIDNTISARRVNCYHHHKFQSNSLLQRKKKTQGNC